MRASSSLFVYEPRARLGRREPNAKAGGRQDDQRPRFPRQLGIWMTSAIVVGSMIGSGIFLLPVSLAPLGINAVVGWVVSGFGALASLIRLARLAHRRRRHPGQYRGGVRPDGRLSRHLLFLVQQLGRAMPRWPLPRPRRLLGEPDAQFDDVRSFRLRSAGVVILALVNSPRRSRGRRAFAGHRR